MKKKDIRKGYTQLGILVIFLIILIISLATYGLIDKFDADEDVCIEYSYEDFCLNFISGDKEIEEHCLEAYSKSENKGNCKQYRPKTECEKCVDDWSSGCNEECVCEEKKYANYCDFISLGYERGECYRETGRCSSAREKTECEKGNGNWILINTTFRTEEGIPYGCILDSIFDVEKQECQPNKICEKKRFWDFSCKEIKLALFSDYEHFRIKDGLLKETIFSWGTNRKDLIDLLESKGCEI